MTSKSKFFRARATLKEFDGDLQEESTDEVHESSDKEERGFPKSGSSSKAVVQASVNASNHILLASMLEHLCSIYGRDPAERRKLFRVLYGEFVRHKILQPLGGEDELSGLRSQYTSRFTSLVQAALQLVSKHQETEVVPHEILRDKIFIQPRDLLRSHQRLSVPDLEIHQSRYRDEFVELCRLGKGAYGNVFKCRHKLDGCEYAVKKIAFHDMKPDLWFKVLREVKYLAGLNHKYVVRYHGAWLEEYADVRNTTAFDTNRRAIGYKSDDDSLRRPARGAETLSSHIDNSIDVVFEDSNGSKVKTTDLSDSSTSDTSDSSTTNGIANSGNHFKMPVMLLHIQMQVCERTLKEWISDRNFTRMSSEDKYAVIDEEQCCIILKQILKGLEYVHSQNLIHRDLKPKNIFLMATASGALHAKVGDFGLARHVENEDEPLTPFPGRHKPFEEAGPYTTGVGTTIYAAPEQLQGSDYSCKSDMYSLGLILFELYHPFQTEMERIDSIQEVRKRSIPAAFEHKWTKQTDLLGKLLHADPDSRPTASEVLMSEFFLSKDQLMTMLRKAVVELSATVKDQAETIRKLQEENYALKETLHQRDQLIAEKDTQLKEKETERS